MTQKTSTLITWVALFVVVLVGCGSATESISSASPDAIIKAEATGTSEPTNTLMPLDTPEPTSTLELSNETPAKTPSFTPTPEPTSTPEPTLTPTATPTLIPTSSPTTTPTGTTNRDTVTLALKYTSPCGFWWV